MAPNLAARHAGHLASGTVRRVFAPVRHAGPQAAPAGGAPRLRHRASCASKRGGGVERQTETRRRGRREAPLVGRRTRALVDVGFGWGLVAAAGVSTQHEGGGSGGCAGGGEGVLVRVNGAPLSFRPRARLPSPVATLELRVKNSFFSRGLMARRQVHTRRRCETMQRANHPAWLCLPSSSSPPSHSRRRPLQASAASSAALDRRRQRLQAAAGGAKYL